MSANHIKMLHIDVQQLVITEPLNKMMPRYFFLLLAVILQVYAQSDLPIVETPNGKIQGIVRKRESGETYLQFQGVPYANPPIGERRFAPPEPVSNWEGIWVANTTYTCIQVDHHDPPQEGITKGYEDCLFLDIYVPGEKVDPKANLDVIVHIHAGLLGFGSSGWYANPKPFMSKNILFVSLNYRLGIFGFLSLEDDVLPGNNGMRDQVMALQWIQDNIKLFGGNPDSVTLTGFDSVHYHMMSPLSKGLFHRAISASGTALDPWGIHEEPRRNAEEVGRAVGCPHEGNSKTFLACLRSRTPFQLVETTKLFREFVFYPISPFGLVVDSAAKKPFLPEHPYKLLEKGKVYDIPWISCMASSPGLYPFAQLMKKEEYLDKMAKNLEKYLPLALDYYLTVPKDKMDEVTKNITKEYLGDKPLDNSTFQDLVHMGSDRLYRVGLVKTLRLQTKVVKSPLYFLHYNFTSENVPSTTEVMFGIKEKYGVCAGDDMFMIFEAPMEYSKAESAVHAALVDLWVTFAKTGKTGYDNWGRLNGNAKVNSYLYVGLPSIEARFTHDFDNQPFWDSLPIMENEKLVEEKKKKKIN